MSTPTQEDVSTPQILRSRRAIVVVDVVESVRLMQAHEADVIDRWRRFVNDVRSRILPLSGGRLVKSLGDGMLLEFEQVPQAIAAALRMHEGIAPYNEQRSAEDAIQLRMGVHAADVVVDDLDVYGAGVNLAARLAGIAAPGDIVVSAQVRDEVVHGIHADIHDLGDCWLKHIDTSVRAFRLRAANAPSIVPAPARSIDLSMGLAVVPFDVRVGGHPSDSALADALADDMIANFSQWPEWRVLSRLSTTAFRNGALGIEHLREQLGAAYVVWGSLHSDGIKARVMPQFIDSSDGRVLWSGQFQFDVADLFAGQAKVVDELVHAVSHALIERELQRARSLPLPSLQTYSVYLGAMAMLHRLSNRDFQNAKTLLEHLAERVPRSAAPHALLAKWHILQTMQGYAASGAEPFRFARAAARRATQLDPEHAFGLAVEGLVCSHAEGDFDRAAQCFQDALKANPQEPYAWCFLSGLHTYRGEAEEAERAADNALRLSPLDPTRYHFDSYAANAKLAAGKYEQAVALALESITLNSYHTPSYRILAIAQVLAGREQEASATVQTLLRLEPGFNLRHYIERYPGRDGPMAKTYVAALRAAGIPE